MDHSTEPARKAMQLLTALRCIENKATPVTLAFHFGQSAIIKAAGECLLK